MNVGAQDLAQGRLKEVGGGVVSGRRFPSIEINHSCDLAWADLPLCQRTYVDDFIVCA